MLSPLKEEPAQLAPPPPAPAAPTPAGTAVGWRVHAALVLVQLWLASLGVAGKLVLRHMTPAALTAARTTGAALVLLLLLFAGRLLSRRAAAPLQATPLRRGDFLRVVLYALLGITFNQLLFVTGLSLTTVANAVVLSTSIPVLTFALAVLLGRERSTGRRLAGLGLALCGALLLTGLGHLGGTSFLLGNSLILLHAVSYASYLVLSRPLLSRYPALLSVSLLFVVGSLTTLPVGGAALWAALPLLSGTTLLTLAYIVVFPTVGVYFLNVYALKRAPASLVAVYVYMQPIVAALLAAWLLGERPSLGTLIAGGLIALGLLLVSR